MTNNEITKLIHSLELACQLANTQQAEIERLKNELHGKVEYITMDVREKLVELLKSDLQYFQNDVKYWHDEHIGELADCLIANGVTVQEWISVKDRLPDIYEKEPDWSVTVLFRTIQGHIHSGYRNIGRPQKSFYDDDWTPPYWLDESENLSFEEDEVTHWMLLPQPPKRMILRAIRNDG